LTQGNPVIAALGKAELSEGAASSRSGIERFDLLAQRMLRAARPVHFDIARSARELDAVYRLRFRTIVERGWACREQFQSGIEKDEYDDTAVQIVALQAGAVVGATRIVLPSPGCRLPTEEAFSFNVNLHNRVADVARACRDSRYHDPHQRVFLGLLSKAWIEIRARGFTNVLGVMEARMMRLYQGMGFRVTALAASRLYWGVERSPVLICPREATPGIHGRRSVE